jgi:hypothetical protein
MGMRLTFVNAVILSLSPQPMISRNINMVGQYLRDVFIMMIFKNVLDRIDRIFLDIHLLAFRKPIKPKDNPDNPVNPVKRDG